MDTRVYAPVHRRVVFQRVYLMNKSLDILDKNCSVETQSPLIYKKDIKTRKRIG